MQVQVKPTDSCFWKGLMGVKDDFFKRGSFVIGDDTRSRFWEDAWSGNTPLAESVMLQKAPNND
jgi:hypothetical protein